MREGDILADRYRVGVLIGAGGTSSKRPSMTTTQLQHRSLDRRWRGAHLVAAFSADGRSIAVGSEAGIIAVVDVVSLDEVCAHWPGHRGAVRALALAPDGKIFASAGDDGQILIWPLVP